MPVRPDAAPDPQRRRALRLGAQALGGLALGGWAATPAQALPAALALPRRVGLALREAGIAPANCSLVVRDLQLGTPLVNWLPAHPRTPASVLKLVTMYAALNLLGPTYRWRTPVLAVGPLDAGVLAGDLAFVGSGDPHLMAEDLWQLALRLRGLGLRRIAGNVLVDRSAFALPPHDPAAFDGNALAPYNVGPDAFLVNFGSLQWHLQAQGDKVGVWVEPPVQGLAVTPPRLGGGACGDWRQRLQPDFTQPLAPRFDGSFSAACGEQSWNIAALMPPDAFVQAVLGAVFRQAGIDWSGSVVSGRVPPGAQLLTTWESQTLAVLTRDIDKYSNNVMTQQVFLTLALQAGQAPADFPRAATATRQWLDAQGLDMPDLRLDNGCGLSRRAQLSARDLERLLRAAWANPLMPEFVASLPLAGEDGTLRKRLRVEGLRGMLHAKTGTLDGVSALAGYLQARDGARRVVVALVNDPRAERAWPALQALLEHAAGLA
ncbi:MAG: D-alanyl-D-alanine carboxypeptidase/D-alanyl-D-alanine-endopeptidase [Betaproteobacteria bacterium]|nr:D-alanyl-D-alanine carboxypeptidase/D-alanyl-D-alanine-endopeptidase [Betaproteobacteria bacterium]